MNAATTTAVASAPLALDQLADEARRLRRNDITMVHRAGLGHLGGELSALDILTVLFRGGVLRVDPAHPHDPQRDRFVLSKGHAAAALYTTLAAAGFFPEAELATFMQPLSRLNGHPDRRKVPGVETNTGPLGHGFPVAVGCALGARIRGESWRTFVLCGDGELQEGSMWEAAMSAAHFGLDTLTLVVDRNRLQQGDRTETTMALDSVGDRFRAFNWTVVDVDGHDHAALHAVLTAPRQPGRPTCVIATTRKGNGVSFMTDVAAWHHRIPNDAEFAQALEELA